MVDLIDCVRKSDSPWARKDAWHWLLARPLEFRTPIPCRGRLGLFMPEVSAQQVGAARRYARRHRRRHVAR